MARPRTASETDDAGFTTLADSVSPLVLTGLNQPLWLQNSTYPAALDRQLIAAALDTGVQGLTDLIVSQRAAGANLSVDVAAGRVVVPVTDAPNLGSALCTSTAVNNLVVAGAPGAGLSRIDLVIARVYDASVIGGSINGWQLEVVTGTPAASPAAPATPVSSHVLAQVVVAAGQVSVTNANITDRRTLPPGTWLPYSVAWTGAAANPGLSGSATLVGRYRMFRKLVNFSIKLFYGTGSSGGQGSLFLGLPVPANPNNPVISGVADTYIPSLGASFMGILRYQDANRFATLFTVSAANAAVLFWSATTNGGAGTGIPQVAGQYSVQDNGNYNCSGWYEAA